MSFQMVFQGSHTEREAARSMYAMHATPTEPTTMDFKKKTLPQSHGNRT